MKRPGCIVALHVSILTAVLLIGCANREAVVSLSFFHWNFELDQSSPVYAAIRSRLNVDMEALSAPWSEWPDKLNVMIASGEIPDIFITYGPGDPVTYEHLARDGLLLSLSPYLDEYPNIRRRLEGRENQRLDGEYFALPVALPKSDHVGMVRGDWLDQLSLNIPETLTDLYDTAREFKRAFGIVPISSSPSHTAGFFWLNQIFYAYGGGWETWLEDATGSYVMCWVSEGNREGLSFLNRLYRDGLLDPEFFSNTDSQKMDRLLSGKAGIVVHNTISEFSDKMRSVDARARLDIFDPLVGPGGKRGQWAMDGFFTALSIHSQLSDEKREKALELLDFLYSDEGTMLLRYGVVNVHYKEEDGLRTPLLPSENGAYRRLREADKTAVLRDIIELGDIWTPEWDRNLDLIQHAVVNGEKFGQVPLFLYDKTEAEKRYGKQLISLVFEEYVKLVQSDDYEADWNQFVDIWNENGGREMTDERNRNTSG